MQENDFVKNQVICRSIDIKRVAKQPIGANEEPRVIKPRREICD